jgi:hypothetical protein
MYIGGAGDKPMPGNFENTDDEYNDFAVFSPSGSPHWLTRTFNSVSTPNLSAISNSVTGQLATDKPVVGDFDGDGRDNIGYYRDGLWYSSGYVNYGVQLSQSFQWGMAGDIPVPDDYDGDRQTDYAVFRPSTGVWWVNLSSGGYWSIQFGMNGDIPVPADYDGDGKADIAIYRAGQWWRFLSATGTVDVVNWGMAGDIPIPAQMQ